LLGGGPITTAPVYPQLEAANLDRFALSTARLAEMANAYRRVFVCHFLRFDEPSALVREIAAGFKALLAGEAFSRDDIDCLNYPVKEACFEHFSIFIPAGEPTKI